MENSYSSICSECGKKSDEMSMYCDFCGAQKAEMLRKISFYESLIATLSKQITFVENPEVLVRLIFRAVTLIAGIFIIPDFIKQSELFWLVCTIFLIVGFVQDIESQFIGTNFIYPLSKALVILYIGAALGAIVFYTGRTRVTNLGGYFNPEFILNEIQNGNSLVIVGMIFSIISAIFFKFLKRNYTDN